MSATFAPPPGRPNDLSPVSAGSGSEWSGMNNYNSTLRQDAHYDGSMSYARNESDSLSDLNALNGPPMRPFPPPGMDGPHRPRRPSESGSQQSSSRAASVANSRSSSGTISDQNSRKYRKMETELQQHYTILKNFLKGGAPQPPRPNKARDKLLRLSPVQFHELSTDVFDELQRRQASAPLPGRPPRRDIPPFLQPRPEFHEKRNQARQKLSSLQTSRFRDLSTDVFCELERRFPHFGAPDGRRRDSARSISSRGGRGPPPRVNTSNMGMHGPGSFPPRNGSMPGRDVPQFDNPPLSATSASGGDFGRPVPKQFQSNTVTPNKSTMVEDDEEDESVGETRSSDAFRLDRSIGSRSSDHETPATSVTNPSQDMKSLQDKISDLEKDLESKDDKVNSLRDELDKKLEDAERLERSLKEEIYKLQAEHANRERDLQSQLSAAKRDSEDGGIWKTKHQQLERDHGNLQQDHDELQSLYEEQQKITAEVSRQGTEFLREMRAMAEEQGDGNLEREEKLQEEVTRLQVELVDWKNRYAKAKTDASTNKAAPAGGIRSISMVQTPGGDKFHRLDGVIKDVHITRFQLAIDELLQGAREQEPVAVMDLMKPVVIAVRNIVLDVEGAKQNLKDEDDMQKRIKLKERVSATANNVITACKNYAAAGGISPVSLLDAAASHLSAAVVDLARMVKICPASGTQQGYNDTKDVGPAPEGTPEPMNEAGYFTMSQRLRRDSAANSVYSALSSPNEENGHQRKGSENQRSYKGVPGVGNGPGSTGLGIQSGLKLKEDDTELQELKIYLENQTDLLVQTIQALVSSVRNEDSMEPVQGHISGILDVVENVLSAAEGAMDDASWYQPLLKHRALPAVNILATSKDRLIEVANSPEAQVDGISTKAFTQKLPPLAFRLARDTKDLVARIESVEAGQTLEDDEDFR